LGHAISKALSSAGAVVYALDKVQENLDSLVAEVLQFLLFVCLSIFSEDILFWTVLLYVITFRQVSQPACLSVCAVL